MYRTPNNVNRLSVAPDVFWRHQPQHQQPPVPPPTGSSHQSAQPPPSWPTGFMETPGALPPIPPYPLPGRLGPFLHNSVASHYTCYNLFIFLSKCPLSYLIFGTYHILSLDPRLHGVFINLHIVILHQRVIFSATMYLAYSLSNMVPSS